VLRKLFATKREVMEDQTKLHCEKLYMGGAFIVHSFIHFPQIQPRKQVHKDMETVTMIKICDQYTLNNI
jgi:hypothetical protein